MDGPVYTCAHNSCVACGQTVFRSEHEGCQAQQARSDGAVVLQVLAPSLLVDARSSVSSINAVARKNQGAT